MRHALKDLPRITFDPGVMGGKACVRGMRVTVSMVVSAIAAGTSEGELLKLYPYLETEDIRQCLAYAAYKTSEVDLPLVEA